MSLGKIRFAFAFVLRFSFFVRRQIPKNERQAEDGGGGGGFSSPFGLCRFF